MDKEPIFTWLARVTFWTVLPVISACVMLYLFVRFSNYIAGMI